MKHADAASLERISELVNELRLLEPLNETRPGVFYLRSKAFVHFHVDDDDLYADVRAPDDEDFTRLKVTSAAGQRKLVRIARAACSPRR